MKYIISEFVPSAIILLAIAGAIYLFDAYHSNPGQPKPTCICEKPKPRVQKWIGVPLGETIIEDITNEPN